MTRYTGWATETAFVCETQPSFELYKYSDPQRAIEAAAENYGTTMGVPLRAAQILPFAAEKYGISGKLKDFVISPCIIMPSDLPNRNKVAFPARRLTEFDPESGCLAYQTWLHKPTFLEHANQDYTQAKGIILDVGIRPFRNARGDLLKVNALLAFDRNRDPDLANRILVNRDSSFSMGAYVAHYDCSICGASTQNKLQPNCEHIDSRAPAYKTFQVGDDRILAHWNTGPFRGFETSYVSNGAYVSAQGPRLDW